MKRGEVWTVAGAGYAGKPRPAVVVQDDRFGELDSVTTCLLTTNPMSAPLFRVPLQPTAANGFSPAPWLMADKVTTFCKTQLGRRIGRLDDETMVRLDRAISIFLGIGA